MVVELDELARRMLADYDARTPGQRFGETIGLTTIQAYALQAEIARLRERRGEKVIGYKVGCTSRTMQVQLGVNEPIFGRIFDTECHQTDVRLPFARYANLAIEGELAIRLSRDSPGDPQPDQGYNAAIASVFPVIELHHYVLPVNGPALAPLIASSGMQAGVILPAWETACSGGVPAISELDVTVDDRVVGTTQEPWTMGAPAATLRWLCARLAESGLQLQPGQLILTGSALPLFPVKPGSRVVALARPLGTSCVEID
jgi:2-keto-4-pentenoate hydratase